DLHRWASIVNISLNFPASLPLMRLPAPKAEQEPVQQPAEATASPHASQLPEEGLYQPNSKYAHRGLGLGSGLGKLPTPTTASPGSHEKLAVLEKRAAAGEALFHPDEPRIAPEDLQPGGLRAKRLLLHH